MNAERNGGGKNWATPDGASATELFTTQNRSLVRLAGALVGPNDAPDVVQDMWATAGPRLQSARENTAGFLRTSTANRARSVLRKRALRERIGDVPGRGVPSSTGDGDIRVVTADDVTASTAEAPDEEILLRVAVQRGIASLPAKQREALLLLSLGLNEGEIAEGMRISKGAVKSHTSRGRTALQKFLETEGYSLEGYRYAK